MRFLSRQEAKSADISDDMKDWDEEKLRSVVTQQESKQKTSTDVSCLMSKIGEADRSDRLQVLHPSCRGSEIWLVVSHLLFSRIAMLIFLAGNV